MTEAEKVSEWNKTHEVGVEVDLTRDNGTIQRTATRSYAQLLAGHTAVVWLDDVPECYALSRVKVVEP